MIYTFHDYVDESSHVVRFQTTERIGKSLSSCRAQYPSPEVTAFSSTATLSGDLSSTSTVSHLDHSPVGYQDQLEDKFTSNGTPTSNEAKHTFAHIRKHECS